MNSDELFDELYVTILSFGFDDNNYKKIKTLLNKGASIFTSDYRFDADHMMCDEEIYNFIIENGEKSFDSMLIFSIDYNDMKLFKISVNNATDLEFAYKRAILFSRGEMAEIIFEKLQKIIPENITISTKFEMAIRDELYIGIEGNKLVEIYDKYKKYEEDNSSISSEYRGITHHSLFNYIYVSDLNPNDKSETCIKLYQFSEPTEKNGDKINIKYRLRKKK